MLQYMQRSAVNVQEVSLFYCQRFCGLPFIIQNFCCRVRQPSLNACSHNKGALHSFQSVRHLFSFLISLHVETKMRPRASDLNLAGASAVLQSCCRCLSPLSLCTLLAYLDLVAEDDGNCNSSVVPASLHSALLQLRKKKKHPPRFARKDLQFETVTCPQRHFVPVTIPLHPYSAVAPVQGTSKQQ